VGAYVFRKALLRTMAHIQAAEIHSYCKGNAFFQPSRNCLHETPPRSGAIWKDGCRGGNDKDSIRKRDQYG